MNVENPPTPVMIVLMVVGFLLIMGFMYLNYRCNELQRRNAKIAKALKHLNAQALEEGNDTAEEEA